MKTFRNSSRHSMNKREKSEASRSKLMTSKFKISDMMLTLPDYRKSMSD